MSLYALPSAAASTPTTTSHESPAFHHNQPHHNCSRARLSSHYREDLLALYALCIRSSERSGDGLPKFATLVQVGVWGLGRV
jgi:hypothetical protein